jgi:hypothetical protein
VSVRGVLKQDVRGWGHRRSRQHAAHRVALTSPPLLRAPASQLQPLVRLVRAGLTPTIPASSLLRNNPPPPALPPPSRPPPHPIRTAVMPPMPVHHAAVLVPQPGGHDSRALRAIAPSHTSYRPHLLVCWGVAVREPRREGRRTGARPCSPTCAMKGRAGWRRVAGRSSRAPQLSLRRPPPSPHPGPKLPNTVTLGAVRALLPGWRARAAQRTPCVHTRPQLRAGGAQTGAAGAARVSWVGGRAGRGGRGAGRKGGPCCPRLQPQLSEGPVLQPRQRQPQRWEKARSHAQHRWAAAGTSCHGGALTCEPSPPARTLLCASDLNVST